MSETDESEAPTLLRFAYFKETHPDGSWSLFREAANGVEEVFHREDGWRSTTELSERRGRGAIDQDDRVTESDVSALLRPFAKAEILPGPRDACVTSGTSITSGEGSAFASDALRAIATRRATADVERRDPPAFPEAPAHPAVLVVGYASPPQDKVVVRVREDDGRGEDAVRELTVPAVPNRPLETK